MAVALAEREDCDVVLATDPDCDRMGCAVRNKKNLMVLLTGNQIGSLLADYRLNRYKEKGWIPKAGSQNVCIIKTVVTTGLQEAIGKGHGVKVIDTLTGFKWIASKMRGYEEKLVKAMGPGFDYESTPFADRARLLQEYSTFYAFGTEESYGYLPNDFVRDKDGNAACLMFAELCAWVKSRGLTVPEYLDEIYLKYGFYLEGVINIYYEGASGNAKIKKITRLLPLAASDGVWRCDGHPVSGLRKGSREGRGRRGDSETGPLRCDLVEWLHLCCPWQRYRAQDEVLSLRESGSEERRGTGERQTPGEGRTRPA